MQKRLVAAPLPEGWKNVQLGEICQNISAAYKPNPQGSVPYISLEHLEKGFPVLLGHGIESEARSNKSKFQAGDVLFGKLGADLKKGVQVDFDGICSTDILVLRETQHCLADYVELLVHSGPFNRYANSTISGVTHPRTSWSALSEFVLSLPPKLEQREIVENVHLVRKGAIEQERLIRTTTELKNALMQKLFTEGLRGEAQKETEIGLVPESWEVVDLGAVIDLFAGYAFKSNEGVSSSSTQLLRMGNLYQNKLDLDRAPIFYPESFAEQHRRFVLAEGDLVMSLTGTSGKEDYGFTVKLPRTERTLLLNQRVARIDIADRRLQREFAYQFLLSRKFLDFLYPTAKGMKQANLSTNAMKRIKVVLPSEQEQLEIGECLNLTDRKISLATQRALLLQDLFRTLLHELMTGKVRVGEMANIETTMP